LLDGPDSRTGSTLTIRTASPFTEGC
jgi:hypothetical protein